MSLVKIAASGSKKEKGRSRHAVSVPVSPHEMASGVKELSRLQSRYNTALGALGGLAAGAGLGSLAGLVSGKGALRGAATGAGIGAATGAVLSGARGYARQRKINKETEEFLRRYGSRQSVRVRGVRVGEIDGNSIVRLPSAREVIRYPELFLA